MATKNNPELLAFALRGYAGDIDDGSLFSTPVWLAHVAGGAMAKKGLTQPSKVAMSRGRSVRIETTGGTEFIVKISGTYLERADILRL